MANMNDIGCSGISVEESPEGAAEELVKIIVQLQKELYEMKTFASKSYMAMQYYQLSIALEQQDGLDALYTAEKIHYRLRNEIPRSLEHVLDSLSLDEYDGQKH